MSRGKRPGNRFTAQAPVDVGIIGDVRFVIIDDKIIKAHLLIGHEGYHSQNKANQGNLVFDYFLFIHLFFSIRWHTSPTTAPRPNIVVIATTLCITNVSLTSRVSRGVFAVGWTRLFGTSPRSEKWSYLPQGLSASALE